jgi:hypothetical protein
MTVANTLTYYGRAKISLIIQAHEQNKVTRILWYIFLLP